jgi:hypothetical protein
VYSVSYEEIKIGDLTFKVGEISKDVINKFHFIEIHNPYSSKYEETKDFSYDVMNSLFRTNTLNESCLFDSLLEKLNREEKLKTNSHWEHLQYVHAIFKKYSS